MPVLRSSPASPFGRKVKVAAQITGVFDSLTIVTTDTLDPADPVRKDNPLGKIPVLVLDDGTSLYDSRVIVEYLDAQAGGGRLVPASGPDRWRVLTGQALGDGLTDAGLLLRYEALFRPQEQRSPKWAEHQQGKLDRALSAVAERPPLLEKGLHVDAVSVACALEWLDFRFEGRWRESHPALVPFLEAVHAALPGFASTKPH